MSIWEWILKRLGIYREDRTTTTTTIHIGDNNMDGKIKVGLCVGINLYQNPANNLAGCVNDSLDFSSLLKDIYKFDSVKMLQNSEATYGNFVRNAEELLAVKPDVFVITNSSHGTRIPDRTGTEEDGYCEALCLFDRFLIDHDFKKILEKADPKTHIVILSDSCYSSGVTREFLATMNDFTYESKPKYLPPKDNMEALRVSMMPISKSVFEPREEMNEILLAGSKSDQFSYDASFNNRPNGAFSYYCIKILRENPNLTYRQLIQELNKYLPSPRYPQCPVLQCNDVNKDLPVFG